ncbi:hypothetical protein EBA01_17510 [Xanthomonas oryzae pv. oryzae]|nr:hypothetical protein BVV16_17800 [Xanthomonas oryzae pv. oryzae]AUI95253.1 hypothetical protein BVV17_17830 [Xanthomonas oryzae pv. oryzae]AUI98925.1 hypothetical protein BVV18_17830 [Xanthomonas oryzae pv. oryzae]AUJ02603.1 hypothetical protein BVV10_17835 [Xanthomonas oryzae pv. oryzae]AUJ06271.1 hypothetical protein BVV19_17865 [Xanthomonas oryzae pv. oryzae]
MQLIFRLKTWLVESALPSPLAAHAVNPSMGLDGRIHAAHGPASGEDTAPDSWLVARERNASYGKDSAYAWALPADHPRHVAANVVCGLH